ncbi:MAG: PBECR2 nuclease fold domain-containing protein, partial [Rhodocyclaceae bacterium]|nr:PBECR2 nuclease fold domain-containing protein [Rhodocyclaceae bacterium]
MIRITLDDRALQAALKRVQHRLSDMRPVMADIGELLVERAKERFAPDEIWQAVEKLERGRARVRRRYVARWLFPGEEVPALTVFEWGRDIWQPITAFQPDDVGYLERRGRLGTRLWVRPDA